MKFSPPLEIPEINDPSLRTKPCQDCGAAFPVRQGNVRYCDSCRDKPRAEIECAHCSETFTERPGKRFCSKRCKQRAKDKRQRDREIAARGSADPVVYFIRAESGGPIKIGIAVSPQDRLEKLQCGNPERLVILKTIPGGAGGEQALHALFTHARRSGEWFEPVPELLALLGIEQEPEVRHLRAAA